MSFIVYLIVNFIYNLYVFLHGELKLKFKFWEVHVLDLYSMSNPHSLKARVDINIPFDVVKSWAILKYNRPYEETVDPSKCNIVVSINESEIEYIDNIDCIEKDTKLHKELREYQNKEKIIKEKINLL